MPDTSSTKRSTPFNIHEYVATFFLPDSMLDYFDIVWAEEKSITCTRNRKFILHLRRRRWLDDDGHSIVLNVYQLAENVWTGVSSLTNI